MYDGLIDQISRMNVGEEQDIGISLDFAVSSAFMLCSLGINGKIKRERTVDHAVSDLSFRTHSGKLSGFHCCGHLGIYYLDSGQRSDFRAVDAACFCYGECIFDDVHFIFQSGIGHKCDIG